eukprot:CAMPEP_0117892186 /NCGR_PEP_ID=MMETSP0950-20121206/24480_1 /TAXON_ID=44440 /ORGANISM="Chattonella subsalsa, Strain CCMP2191" /LENGTH=364 /DNA_ID=CAMNT_0005752005 /DNA_START=1 /DNA_END=1097 /DNA_ORIENTATION=+
MVKQDSASSMNKSTPRRRQLSKRWEDLGPGPKRGPADFSRSSSISTVPDSWDQRKTSMSLMEEKRGGLLSAFTDLLKVTREEDKVAWERSARQQIEEVRKQHALERFAKIRAEDEVAELRTTLEKHNSSLREVQSDKEAFAAKLADAEAQLAESRAKLSAREIELEAKEQILAQVHAQHSGSNSELWEDYDQLDGLYHQSQEMVKSLEAELKNQIAVIQSIQKDYKNLSEEKAAVHSELTYVQSNLKKKEQLMETFQLDRKSASKIQEDYKNLSEEKAAVHSELTYVQSNLKKKEQLMETFQLDRKSASKIQEDYKNLSEEKAAVHSELTYVQSNLKKKEQLMETFQLDRKSASKHSRRLQESF